MRLRRRRRAKVPSVRLWAIAAVGVAIGCARGGSESSTVDLTPEDESAFDNGVDFVERPAIVESEWRGAFERRVTGSDAIAVIEVEALNWDEDFRGGGYRITGKVTDRVKGSVGREIVLRVRDGERGYRSVQAYEDRLLGSSFVVFVKWMRDPDSGSAVPRWHLSPDSPHVRDKVTFFLQVPKGDARTSVQVVPP